MVAIAELAAVIAEFKLKDGSTEALCDAIIAKFGHLNPTYFVTGDATGSGTTAIALTLANSGATAGTYQSVTVDAKGRVTAGTNPTTLAGYGITDAQPLDVDLTAIAALSGTAGFLKTNGVGTWSVDITAYRSDELYTWRMEHLFKYPDGRCHACGHAMPCPTDRLIDEVKKLRKELNNE